MKKIIFLVNVDSFLISHRLEIAKELLNKGYQVHIAAQFTSYEKILKKEGFQTHNIRFNRNSTDLFRALYVAFQVFFLIKKIKPNIIHLISIKPIVIGGLISFITPVKSIVISVTGLGSLFLKESFASKLREYFFLFIYRIIFLYPNLKVILQNKSDLNYLKKKSKLKIKNVVMIKGSGINLKKFKFSKITNHFPKISMISRIIEDKGIFEFIKAAELLNKEKFKGKFYLIGNIDKSNPSYIEESIIDRWKKDKKVIILNHKKKIHQFIKNSSLIVLPSYREGFPKILMEAASSGRPVITTNVPGCRDVVINNITGVLVPKKNYMKLAYAIKNLSLNKKKLNKMGKLARLHAEKNFDVTKVVSKHLSIYKSLINVK